VADSASVTRMESPPPAGSPSSSSSGSGPPSCGWRSPSPYHFRSFGPAAINCKLRDGQAVLHTGLHRLCVTEPSSSCAVSCLLV